jgi:hypothetical protein
MNPGSSENTDLFVGNPGADAQQDENKTVPEQCQEKLPELHQGKRGVDSWISSRLVALQCDDSW